MNEQQQEYSLFRLVFQKWKMENDETLSPLKKVLQPGGTWRKEQWFIFPGDLDQKKVEKQFLIAQGSWDSDWWFVLTTSKLWNSLLTVTWPG